MGYLAEAYEKHAPTWIKCIRWRQNFEQYKTKKVTHFACVYLPMILCLAPFATHTFADVLFLARPKNEEELKQVKWAWRTNPYDKQAEVRGQYRNDVIPEYDMSVRRLKYPQYYAGRYDGFYKSV